MPLRHVAAGAGDEGSGDFVLGELLGKGGMGLVFRAEQAGLDRNVALKTIIPDRAADGEARRKFYAEARVTGQLDHPNIVPIHELAAAPDGALFYTMKEVRGLPWSKAMPTLPEAENIDILLKVADAVAFAHGKGVIHRDLKPENVMIGDYGEVLVMDWGLAVGVKDGAKAERLSRANARGGTPAYMAPEMAAADPDKIGTASDIYLLGAILYEILTGLHPHTGPNVFACIASAQLNTIQPSERRDEWMGVARRALAGDPAKRFRDVKEFQRALLDCREHAASLALSKEARGTLTKARTSGDYTDHARAVFGFGEALRLWPENNLADMGLTMARKAYAETALERGDYDLVLSQTGHMAAGDAGDLGQRAEAGKAERERRRVRVKRLALLSAGLLGVVFVVGGLAYWRVSRAERRAVAALAAEQAALTEQARLSRELALAAERLGLWQRDASAVQASAGGEASRGTALATAVTELTPWPSAPASRARVLTALSLVATRPDEFAALAAAFAHLADLAGEAGDAALAERLRAMVRLLEARAGNASPVSPARPSEPSPAPAAVPSPPTSPVPPGRVSDADADRDKALVQTLHEQLKAVNPAYDNRAKITVERGEIVGVELDGFRPGPLPVVTDFTPLRDLKLRRFFLVGVYPERGERARMQEFDLSVLRGMPIRELTLHFLVLPSLEPLREMPLETLDLGKSSVFDDLAPLAGKRLRKYTGGIMAAGFRDIVIEELLAEESYLVPVRFRRPELSVVNPEGLKRLTVKGGSRVEDLSPLRGAPLEYLGVAGNRIRDVSALRGMATLKTLRAANNAITDLSPLEDGVFDELDLTRNPLADLRPLGKVTAALLKLDVTPGTPGVAELRANPRIGRIGGTDVAPRDGTAFWNAFDRRAATAP